MLSDREAHLSRLMRHRYLQGLRVLVYADIAGAKNQRRWPVAIGQLLTNATGRFVEMNMAERNSASAFFLKLTHATCKPLIFNDIVFASKLTLCATFTPS